MHPGAVYIGPYKPVIAPGRPRSGVYRPVTDRDRHLDHHEVVHLGPSRSFSTSPKGIDSPYNGTASPLRGPPAPYGSERSRRRNASNGSLLASPMCSNYGMQWVVHRPTPYRLWTFRWRPGCRGSRRCRDLLVSLARPPTRQFLAPDHHRTCPVFHCDTP